MKDIMTYVGYKPVIIHVLSGVIESIPTVGEAINLGMFDDNDAMLELLFAVAHTWDHHQIYNLCNYIVNSKEYSGQVLEIASKFDPTDIPNIELPVMIQLIRNNQIRDKVMNGELILDLINYYNNHYISDTASYDTPEAIEVKQYIEGLIREFYPRGLTILDDYDYKMNW